MPTAVGNYVNFLQAVEALIVPTYGLSEDKESQETIERMYPDSNVRGLHCQELAARGGVLNCVTWNVELPVSI
jgi:agmatine/peptidylarginine deiminase